MPRVLIVEDDSWTMASYSLALEDAGFSVAVADSLSSGTRAVVTGHPDVVVVELNLPDGCGLQLLREAAHGKEVGYVVIGGESSVKTAVAAMNMGALDYLVKPLAPVELVRSVKNALTRPRLVCRRVPIHSSERHAAARWASAVVSAIKSGCDLRTIPEWAHYIGASSGALRTWCYAARVSAKKSLTFARVLRAIVRHKCEELPFEELLNVTDQRTLRKLYALGRGAGQMSACELPTSVEAFLQEQEWVDNPYAVSEVRVQLTTIIHTVDGHLTAYKGER